LLVDIIRLSDFIIVLYPLLEDEDITLIDERLYGIIYWFTKLKNEKCTASNPILAELVKTTPTTIQNPLTKLEEKGYIQRTYMDKARRHRQEIIPLVVFSKESPRDDTVVSLTDDQNKNIITRIIKKKQPYGTFRNSLIPLNS
jgi:hypothetical protein